MNKKYDANLLQIMLLFEKITGAKVKDCFEFDETLVFIVEPSQIGIAIGKGGINLKKLDSVLKRKFKIVEFNSELERFIQNAIYPSQIRGLDNKDNIITLTPVDMKTRGYLIGRNASNLRMTEAIIKRYFDIKEIKVV